jgi:hypothetical protein
VSQPLFNISVSVCRRCRSLLVHLWQSAKKKKKFKEGASRSLRRRDRKKCHWSKNEVFKERIKLADELFKTKAIQNALKDLNKWLLKCDKMAYTRLFNTSCSDKIQRLKRKLFKNVITSNTRKMFSWMQDLIMPSTRFERVS